MKYNEIAICYQSRHFAYATQFSIETIFIFKGYLVFCEVGPPTSPPTALQNPTENIGLIPERRNYFLILVFLYLYEYATPSRIFSTLKNNA